jgi:hypothetical protein
MIRKHVDKMKNYEELKRHKIVLQPECLILQKKGGQKKALKIRDMEWTLRGHTITNYIPLSST